ncbi:MAG: GNAT family N-acetyltransferase [Proteobacteria bacterium]|nr:GNAT family N-acetyltransferase [Pseudomonadota bacterium]MBU4469405.1 GNAT family N-acetyltransferase [Pseudomonadota bacterium]MCG2752305.1 GNAT family N-acetyltransferase [Desulfobacteraceae bacterium]
MDQQTYTTSSSAEFSVHSESFETVSEYFSTHRDDLKWTWVFTLPSWIQSWWKIFGAGYEPLLLSVRDKDRIMGLAIFKQKNDAVSFLGSADICDYFDFVVARGREEDFFSTLLNHLNSTGVKQLDLRCLRPESVAGEFLIPLARKRGYSVECEPDGVSFEVALPETWEDYLQGLSSKQRHEVRRKLRRLYDAGDVRFEVHGDLHLQTDKVDLFFSLFKESREDKKEFMTPRMADFFKDMIFAMKDILKMGVLLLDAKVAAVILFFDYNNAYYLYNNGYDTEFSPLSIGVLSKVLAIQHAIGEKKKTFDFLKGEEVYKSRLGGREISLSRYRIHLE